MLVERNGLEILRILSIWLSVKREWLLFPHSNNSLREWYGDSIVSKFVKYFNSDLAFDILNSEDLIRPEK